MPVHHSFWPAVLSQAELKVWVDLKGVQGTGAVEWPGKGAATGTRSEAAECLPQCESLSHSGVSWLEAGDH